MTETIRQFLSGLRTVSSSPLALIGYLAVLTAWLLIAYRIKRNKELLRHIEKLPEGDRLKAFQSEIGEVPIKGGFTPEQYIRFRITRYHFIIAVSVCLLIAYLLTLTKYHPLAHNERRSVGEWNEYQLIRQIGFDYGDEEQDRLDYWQEVWGIGDDGTWNTYLAGGQYWAENMTDQTAIQYIYIDSAGLPGDWDKTVDVGPFNPISVDVTVASSEPIPSWISGAGLLFRFRPRLYYVYIVGTTGHLYFLQFSEGYFSLIFETRLTGFSDAAQYKLGIAGDKGTIGLYLNDMLLHRIGDTRNVVGPSGIVVIGKGRYVFDNFRIYNAID